MTAEYTFVYIMTMTTDTDQAKTIVGDEIPAAHLVTAIPAPGGSYWLYGYRGHDLTARFDMVWETDTPAEGTVPWGTQFVKVLLRNADWPTACKALGKRMFMPTPDRVAAQLRTVLPAATYKAV